MGLAALVDLTKILTAVWADELYLLRMPLLTEVVSLALACLYIPPLLRPLLDEAEAPLWKSC